MQTSIHSKSQVLFDERTKETRRGPPERPISRYSAEFGMHLHSMQVKMMYWCMQSKSSIFTPSIVAGCVGGVFILFTISLFAHL